MPTTLTSLDPGHSMRGEGRRPNALWPLLLTAALAATAGALATTLLDRRADASALARPAPASIWAPILAGDRDTSVPDAADVFLGRAATPDEPIPSF